jgi:hypothetical protein
MLRRAGARCSSSDSLAPARLAPSGLPLAVDPAAATPHVCFIYTPLLCAVDSLPFISRSDSSFSFKKELTLFLTLIHLRVAIADRELMDQLVAHRFIRAVVAFVALHVKTFT